MILKVCSKISFLLLFTLIGNYTYSQPFSFGFGLGIATPNDEINNVYNSDKINLNNNIGNVIRDAVKLGYYIGTNLNLPLSKDFSFRAGISLNRFPKSELKIYFPNSTYDTVILKSLQNIIPISVGFDWFLYRSFVNPYLTGNLSYYYILHSIDIVRLNQELPISTSETDSRLGAGIGAGLDFDLKILTIFLEGKYWFVNLIGGESNEQSKNFFSLGLGVIFGGR
ncbi:MAG: hypothetical protein N2517_07370 [Ignavibacteria bacterium]|nr:hypothetical protein [Ignavibacteria bacterium]